MAHIVVLDDQEAMRRILQQILEEEGHHVSLAPDGRTGLQVLHERPAEVLITDIFMPEPDGIEMMHLVRSQFPAVQIIAMSGGGRGTRTDVLLDAQRLGAHQTLAKPFTRQALLAAVRAVLPEEPRR
jgi:DNA-binding NtrC family response regulator